MRERKILKHNKPSYVFADVTHVRVQFSRGARYNQSITFTCIFDHILRTYTSSAVLAQKTSRVFRAPYRRETCNCIDYAKYTPMFYSRDLFSRDEKNSRSPPGFAYILICDYTKETLWLSVVLFDFQMRLHASLATRIYAKIYGNCIVSVHLSKLLMAIKLLMRDCSAKR